MVSFSIADLWSLYYAKNVSRPENLFYFHLDVKILIGQIDYLSSGGMMGSHTTADAS